MKTFVLPAGLHGDLLAHAGWMYVSYQDVALGLVVARWQHSPDVREMPYVDPQGHGWGRLGVALGVVHVAYRDRAGEIAVGDVHQGLSSKRLAGQSLGNYPCVWGDDSLAGTLAIQRPPSFGVQVAVWPIVPNVEIGQGKPTGLSQLRLNPAGDIQIVTQDDERTISSLDDPHWVGQSRVSQWHAGGVLCHLDGVTGLLRPGEGTYQPRLARQDDGRWTIFFGGRDSRGATAQTVLTDVTAADLLPLDTQAPIEIPTIAPFNAPKFIEGANVRNTNGRVIRTDTGAVIASWCDLEQSELRGETIASALAHPKPRIAYWNDRAVPPESILSQLLHGEMVGLRCFREPGESATHLYDLMSVASWMLAQRGLKLVPVCGFSDRLGTLTEAQVVECVSAVYAPLLRLSNVPGALCFGIGRADGTAKYPSFAACIKALGDASPGVPDLTLSAPAPTPTPPAPQPPTIPAPSPAPVPAKGRKPMKPDSEFRAYITQHVAPALATIGVPNPSGLAIQVGDHFRSPANGAKARDPLPTEFEFFCRVLHKGGNIDTLVKECLQ